VTTRGLGLLESVVGGESGHHVEMCGNEDPQTNPWDSNRVSIRAMVFGRVIRFLAASFFDFRFGVNASRFFNLPHPLQTLRKLRDPRCPSRNLLLPLNVRFFARPVFGKRSHFESLIGLGGRKLEHQQPTMCAHGDC
jgi:hypothetical protein